MKALVLTTKPYSDFPTGCMTYAVNAALLLKAPLYTPSKDYVVEIGLRNITNLVTNSFKFTPDYVLYAAGNVKNIPSSVFALDCPIISLVHDILYLYEDKTVLNISDGFIVHMDETAAEIRKFRPDAKILRTKLPYVFQDFNVDLKAKENAIISAGRIVPDKGHRIPAQLAKLGYDVRVVGQHVDHDEYELYYQKILATGAHVIPSPSSTVFIANLKKAKIFMEFTFLPEQQCQPEYTTLEAIECGLFPIVAPWMERYIRESGLKFSISECGTDAKPDIDYMFSHPAVYKRDIVYNFDILKHWSDDYKTSIESFVNTLVKT